MNMLRSYYKIIYLAISEHGGFIGLTVHLCDVCLPFVKYFITTIGCEGGFDAKASVPFIFSVTWVSCSYAVSPIAYALSKTTDPDKRKLIESESTPPSSHSLFLGVYCE